MRNTKTWKTTFLSPTDIGRVEKAIAAAEKLTCGEIVVVIVKQSAVFGHVAPLLFLLFLTALLVSGGYSAQLSYYPSPALWLAVDCLALSILAYGLSMVPLLKRLLTQPADLRHQVDARAELEFFEQGLNRTRGRTGVLIFLSILEQRAVVLADEAVDSKMPPDTWDDVVRLIVSGIKSGGAGIGLANAVERCGNILSQSFLPLPDDTDELRNALIIKD